MEKLLHPHSIPFSTRYFLFFKKVLALTGKCVYSKDSEITKTKIPPFKKCNPSLYDISTTTISC
jgi:hypothetical protein